MTQSPYDVAIIGAGVSGSCIARALSFYNINTVLLEKCTDVGFGVSKANSGIIHAGFHHKADSLKAKLEIQGNLMFERLQYELGFPFKRVGILVVAFSYEEMKTIEHLYEQGRTNQVPGLEICGAERMRSLEPNINEDVVGGLYAPTGGIIEPYRFVFALTESAKKNGVDILTDFKVSSAKRCTLTPSSSPVGRGEKTPAVVYCIRSSSGKEIQARYVVNAAGLFADEVSAIFNGESFKIKPRKGEEYLLDRNAACFPNHVLFPVPSKNSKGMLVIPTAEGTTMIGPTAEMIDDKEDLTTSSANLDKIFTMAKHMVPSVSRRDIITAFTGLRPAMEGNDFFIDISKKAPNFIQVAGIQSPGLTASPAIGEYVKDLLKKAGLILTEKEQTDMKLEPLKIVREKEPEEVDRLVQENPEYGNIICRCESISEAEIIEAIHKGHTTLDGIKFYTRSGMGRCQGGFCTYKILKIIARETGMDFEEITKRGAGSFVVKGKLFKGKEN